MSERLSKQNQSSKPKTTRVNSRKKQTRTTVGITITPKLLAQPRNHNLNISRITSSPINPRVYSTIKRNRKL